MSTYMRVEDLEVYKKLCQLHIEVCDLTRGWPTDERYELGSQVRRSSNSAPANLAEKHGDCHIRNKIEGVNRGRGEAAETIHHLYIAKLKQYIDDQTYESYRQRYQECIRMLNGMEKTLEKQLPPNQRRWPEQGSGFRVQGSGTEDVPSTTVPRTLNPKPFNVNSEPRLLNPKSQTTEPRTLNPEP